MNFFLKYPPFFVAIMAITFVSCSKIEICGDCDFTGPYTANYPAPFTTYAPIAIAFYDSLSNQPIGSKLLTGKYSADDDTIVSYAWGQIDGPSIAHITAPGSMETIVSNLLNGIYSFELIVTDKVGLTGKDSVRVTVVDGLNAGNSPWPVVDAGPDQTITLPLDSTYLAGNGSIPNGFTAPANTIFRWTIIAAPVQPVLNPAPRLSPELTKTTVVASRLVPGVYLFTFTITEPGIGSVTDTVQVTVLDDPQNRNTITYHNLVWEKANPSVASWLTTFLATPLRPDLWDPAGVHRKNLDFFLKPNALSTWIVVPFKTNVNALYVWFGLPYTGLIITNPDNPLLVGTKADMRIKIL
ncbi:MAG: hypothetical protein H7122_16125 [Chitinophagaceae bacterium]|nr:hypothetical protein [Chitinophagaceae bacterium]